MDHFESLFWNNVELRPPEFVSCPILSENPNVICGKLATTLDQMTSELNCLQQLNTEAAFISRLVYRFKRKLHHDKAFKSLHKINHLLHNYLKLAICDRVREVRNCVYDGNGPSKQVLQYHLVNILRFSSLFNQLIIVCLDGGRYLKDRVTSGDFWTAASLCIAPISRIWTLSRHLVECCCEWYEEIKCYLSCVSLQGDPWLPAKFQLPSSVSQWLQYPAYLPDKIMPSKKKSMMSLDQTELSVKNSPGHKIGVAHLQPLSAALAEDIGESVSRETVSEAQPDRSGHVQSDVNKKKDSVIGRRPSRNQISELVGKLKTSTDLIEYIGREAVLRNLPDSDSLTKHLSEMNWKKLQRRLSSHAASIEHVDDSREKQSLLSKARQTLRYFINFSENK